MSCYFYDAAGERTVKLTSETEMVHVNGKKVGGSDAVTKFTAYVSPYFVVSNGGAYTKHIYAANQRIASKLGNEDGFGADPRRVEMAGGKKISDFQKGNVGERFKALGYEYSAPEKEKVEKDSTMDSEAEEKLIFFYHPDHLGSTSYVTDADGNIAQHVEYIPYGEVFVEERNNSFSTNYLFNAKELDNETGLYYYGARYLDPTGGMWLSVDPLFEKYAGMSPYNYCMGNPVKMVDPDGGELQLAGDQKLKDLAISHLQAKVGSGYALSMNEKGIVSGKITGERIKRSQQRNIKKLSEIIEDKNIRVRLKVTKGYRTSSGRVLLGGAFMGNRVHGEKAVATQEVNPEVLDLVDEVFKKETGSMLFHEVTEAYIGAQISIAKGESAKEAIYGKKKPIFDEAHDRATPQSGTIEFDRYDKDGNFLYGNEGTAKYYNIIAKQKTDIYDGFRREVIKSNLKYEDIMK